MQLRARGAERMIKRIAAADLELGRIDEPARRSAAGTPASKAACAASAKPPPRAARCEQPRYAGPRRRAPPIPAAARGGSGRPERRDGRRCRRSSPRACPRGRAPAFSACTISARTSPALRKRTSALAGCTLTSTSRASKRDEQREQRMAVARQIIGVSRAHRADEKLVAHRPAVDEQILAERIGPRQRRQRGIAVDRRCLRARRRSRRHWRGNRRRARRRAARAARWRRAAWRQSDRRALLAGEREGDIRPAHGEPAHHFAHRLGLGAVEFQEFQPRRRGVEQVAHFDARAAAERRGLDLAISRRRRPRSPRRAARSAWRVAIESRATAPIDGNASPRKPSVRIETRSSSASFEVAWRSTASARSARVMPSPSSATRMSRRPPPSVSTSMRLRAGIERVLDQLLDHARRPLDHLARGDAVDDGFGKLADGHELRFGCDLAATVARIERRRNPGQNPSAAGVVG